MKNERMAVLLVAVAVTATLTGCAGIVGSAYDLAVTKHDAGACAGLKGKTFEEVKARLDLKPDTIDDLPDGTQKMLFTRGNFEAEIVLDQDGMVKSTTCGDKDQLRKQRFAKQYQSQRVPGAVTNNK